MKQIILGIDPGTRATGFGIINKHAQHYEALTFGVIRTKPEQPLHQRYLYIYNELSQLIQQHSPDVISVETQFLGENIQSAFKVGMVRGVVLLLAAQKEIPIFEYAPKKAKIAVTGNGASGKEQVLRMIKLLLNIQNPLTHDAADALAIAICHAHHNRHIYV